MSRNAHDADMQEGVHKAGTNTVLCYVKDLVPSQGILESIYRPKDAHS